MIDFEAAVQGISRAPEPEPEEPLDPEEELRKKIFGHTLNDDGTLRCVSPSQYKTHKLCNLKWYQDKVMKKKRKPKGKGAKLGTECHKREEKWLTTGVDIRGPLERYGHEMIEPYLPRAPFNGGDMLVEAPLLEPQIKTPGGILISGFSDVTLPPDDIPLAQILDHKFKKKLAQYADTREDLEACEPQAVIYSVWALLKWPEAIAARFAHHNHQTEGARLNLTVAIADTREKVFQKWAKVGKYIDEEMTKTALIKDVLEVPFSPGACRAFGGCDFLDSCPQSPHNRYMNALAQGSSLPEMPAVSRSAAEPPTTQGYDLMGLLDEMMNAPPPASAPAAATTTTTPTPAASAAPKTLTPVEASACKTGGLYMVPGGAVGKFEGVMGDRAIFKGKDGGLLACAATDFVRDLTWDAETARIFEGGKPHKKLQIDDQTEEGLKAKAAAAQAQAADTTPKIDPAAGIVPKDAPADTNPPKEAVQPAATTTAATTTTQPAAASTEPAPAAEPAKKKAGRPPGSTNKPKLAGEQAIILVNNACPAAEDLAPYVAGLCDALAKKANVADVRMGDKTSDLAYGGWKAILTVMAKNNPPPPGLYVLAQSELAEPVIDALSTTPGCIVSLGRGK